MAQGRRWLKEGSMLVSQFAWEALTGESPYQCLASSTSQKVWLYGPLTVRCSFSLWVPAQINACSRATIV